MKQIIKNYFTRALFLLIVSASSLLILFPPGQLDSTQLYTAVLGLLVIGLWATTLIPEYITALVFFCISMLLSVAPPSLVFSGFSSSVFWLVFGGLIIGLAIKKTGLGKHIATLIVNHLESSYLLLISGIVMIGVLFSFLMPSAMARMVLLIPVMLLVASHFGFEKGSNGHTAIILAAITGAFLPAFSILPANVANMILTGMYEVQFGGTILYGEYLLLHFPILGFIKPKNRSWNVARMNKVLKIKVFLDNFDFIRSHSTGEVKILQKSLRFSALGIHSSFNCGF